MRARIVGKGPSLRYLRADHFGQGIVITQYTDGLNINFLTPENGRRPDVK